ncbi:MAG: hypothetical protein PHC84_06155 [Clostridia bacterium]|nr:hypothetical protein [Clostridia bacterium]
MKLKDKIKKFAAEHEAVWQFVKFTIISSIAGVTEITSYTLLNSLILKSMNTQPFHWWIFHYSGGVAGGLGTMIAFLVSTTLAQIVSFVTNRKKTFDANNNVVFSAIMYTVMVLVIICLQTYTGPLMVVAIDKLINNPGISGTLGKLIWMFLSFVIIFPMNKFVIMRRKKLPEAAEAAPQE